jgi:hypothetical protein
VLAISDFVGDDLRARGAVGCKWLGAVAMLVEHISTHAFERWLWALPQTVGAFAFPMFVASFGALAGRNAGGWLPTSYRLGLLAVMAQSAGYLVGREGQLNALATFALGAWVAGHAHQKHWGLAALGVALGATVEFSVAGVLAISAALFIGNDPHGGWGRYLTLLLVAAILPAWNPSAPPVIVWFTSAAALVCLFLPIDGPDRRGGFAVGYVAQWPVLRAIRDLRDFL